MAEILRGRYRPKGKTTITVKHHFSGDTPVSEALIPFILEELRRIQAEAIRRQNDSVEDKGESG